ncbi:cadherin domain-containing protein [Luteolibacter sp. GHJ8]|uniref:Cadherin domain-containing protein n=1 Tax=Luteolibacter rhizosphaerae TaxID=2989719 RepID=A0ABT3G2F3_9BACT|nr:cadherin domain-containing protein [Luteolibacter rhizosphaerae]MCW1914017.1 cadherin domain-containing protein [Luteolibacter rhizosphaerae]
MELPVDFLERVAPDRGLQIDLPGGVSVAGSVFTRRHDAAGVSMIEGRITTPQPGRFFFVRQTFPGAAGSLVGHILFDSGDIHWKVEPSGPGGAPRLVETARDGLICANYSMPAAASAPEEAPAAHPTDIPIPAYQEILPLQSLPGAAGVIYLDFDGEQGPFLSWGDFDAASPNVTNAQVFTVWKMVCEDFQGFTLNITTDRKVFDEADPGSRQHVIITPTTTASPGSGGVAFVGSYNWVADVPCFAFYSTGKYGAEVISHEVGHTLGLSHDGRSVPPEDYYLGHGSGETGWAPIMGAGYYENLTQWSKGEYAGANRFQDDVAIILTNNHVGIRADEVGDDEENAGILEILADNSVTGEGIIATRHDVDAYRFRTSGGPIDLKVEPVDQNPNLDVMAELVDLATGNYIASSHPDLELAAGIQMELPAGEYLLEISGTGRGNPLLDGYTDYGSMGTYFISGSIVGGLKPERFTIAENSATGTLLGSVAARGDHGSAALVWSILSAPGGFTIDPATGALSVADTSLLDFEALSTRWDDPATVELLVRISDQEDSDRDETIRVVITLTDLNDPPAIAPGALVVLERTRPGTPLLTVESSDPDHFDLPAYEIIAGNEAGWFAIDRDSGVISASSDGVGEVEGSALVELQVQVSDRGSPPLSSSATVSLTVIGVSDGHRPGGLTRTCYEGIEGYAVADLTAAAKWPDQPDNQELLPDFDGGTHGDNYGSVLGGYFIPPVSGSYRFWIASDGASELWLDSSPEQAGANLIASVGSSTDPRFWIDTAPFRSSPVSLAAGQAYFISALHKESVGADHVSVAFMGPGMPKQLLRGIYLAPKLQNYAPQILSQELAIGEDAYAGQKLGIVEVRDLNDADTHSGFVITAGNEEGAFAIDPASGEIHVASRGILDSLSRPSYTLTIEVTDDGSPVLTGAGEITVTVHPAGFMADDGLKQQLWHGVEGTSVAGLTEGNANYPYLPDETRTLVSFDSGPNTGDNYGSRIRALLTPAVTGYYTFHLSSNDQAKLKLGSDATAATAVQVASVSGWTNYGQWTKYASQTSDPVLLEAGSRYYIETLHKESLGADHLQVAWTGPGIASPTVILGDFLTPYDINEAPVFGGTYSFSLVEGAVTGTVIGTVHAGDPEGEQAIHEILFGNLSGAFAIDPSSGVITVSNPAALTIGQHLLTIGAQDGGLNSAYPLRSAQVSVSITVLSDNLPPQFPSSTYSDFGTQDLGYAAFFTASDPNADDLLVYEKVSGPAWLVVESDGSVHGLPTNANVGTNVFVLRVVDPEGLSDEIELTIEVANINDPPFFIELPIVLPLASENQPFAAFLGGAAGDVDSGDQLGFSKQSGPEWLQVGADGGLSGTPGDGDAGANEFVIRVTDLQGAYADATLVITVAPVNDPPVFTSPLIEGHVATEDLPFAGSLALFVADPDAGDIHFFEKLAGPDWLEVAADGTFIGTPTNADVGPNLFVVRVVDSGGASAEATLLIGVENVNDAPVFANNPIAGIAARESLPYIADPLLATDEDAGDSLVYSKEDGPEWLQVATDGGISGIPPAGSAGMHAFIVRATDLAGLHAEASLLIEVLADGMPLPWDVSAVGSQEDGSGAASGQGEFVVTGSGHLSGREDSFQFVWQTLSGDGSVTARLVSLEGGSLSRAGVMIRDSLASNSRHVFLGLSGEGAFRWIRRTNYNGNSSANTSGTATLPHAWVRLHRQGNTITAFKSPDGLSWVQIGSLNAALPETCYFGLAVSSGSETAVSEARFSNVTLDP